MEATIMRISQLLVCAVAVLLITLAFHPFAFAKGRVEFHQMESKILADREQPADKETCVYLPDGYDISGLVYPVEYSLHGQSNQSSRQYWFGSGTDIIDDFVSFHDALPNYRIIVMPSMGKTTRIDTLEWAHLVEEVIPFVEGMYRITAHREGRAISGFSRGGHDALHIALSHPELFSVVAAISAAPMARGLPTRAQLAAHDQQLYPLQFWFAYGQNEEWGITAANRSFISILDQLGLPQIHVEDDGNHADWFDKGRPQAGSKFLSETLGGGVTFIELHGKLPATWGTIKRSR
jgi:enterochelin esterase-like enzyme